MCLLVERLAVVSGQQADLAVLGRQQATAARKSGFAGFAGFPLECGLAIHQRRALSVAFEVQRAAVLHDAILAEQCIVIVAVCQFAAVVAAALAA